MFNLRKSPRYGFAMELSYSYRRNGSTWIGTGRTKDVSEEFVRFENDQKVPQGAELELHIAWPYRLQSVCGLELIVRGPVVRTGADGALIKMKSYEFRTCGERSFDQAASLGTALNVIG